MWSLLVVEMYKPTESVKKEVLKLPNPKFLNLTFKVLCDPTPATR